MGSAVLVVTALALLLFRLVGTPLRDVRQSEEGRPGISLPIPEKGIAVLPLENLSDDKENAFFADGIQDDVLTSLGKIKELTVIARASVMAYRGEAVGVLLKGETSRR